MKKISIFLICSLLMIFGLSFSACADAVTTGGVTAVVTPRLVDSLGNEKQVEFATSAKAETTTTETTTKPAYNQEEMKKDLEELGKEDMAASTIGIFAWVKGLVDWTQGIINALGAAIKAGINSPWGFDLKGFVDLFAPFFKTIGYGLLVILTCSTMSITNKILTNAEQSEENSIQLTDSALFAKTFADFKNAHIPICAFSVYDSDFTHCYGSRINDRAVLLRCFSLPSVTVITAADGILSNPMLRSRLVCRIYLSADSYLMIILDSFAYETFKEDNLKIISSILEKLKITLINQKAVIK